MKGKTIRSFKKIMACLLTVLIISSFGITTAFAATTTASGICGTGVSWTLDSAGLLTISGTGAMNDFTDKAGAPWAAYAKKVYSVSVEDTVTHIGDNAFAGDVRLSSVTIANSVTSIGGSAFADCTGLTSIAFPAYLSSIGEEAFYGCTALKVVEIPALVGEIGDQAFGYDTALVSFTVAAGNSSFSTVDGALVTKDGSTLISYPAGNTASQFTVPAGVTAIAPYAFDQAASLTAIALDEDLRTIGDCAFRMCRALTSVNVPSGVRSVGDEAFSCCSGLTDATLPSSLESLGSRLFYECPSLQSVNAAAGSAYASIDGVLFDMVNGSLLVYPAARAGADYTVPDGIATIAEAAFYSNSTLNSITLPDSLTAIGKLAFRGTNISVLVIPEGVTTIGDFAFSAASLTKVTLPSTLETIGEKAFYSDTKLASISIPGKVTTIGAGAFEFCSALTGVTLPASVESIGASAFHYCTSLKSICVKNPACVIDDCADTFTEGAVICSFAGSTAQTWADKYSHTFIAITDAGSLSDGAVNWTLDSADGSLSVIGNGAIPDFTGTDAAPWAGSRDLIKSVNIGSGITSIGNNAFYGCSSLTSVTLPDTVTLIGSQAFMSCEALTSVTLPSALTGIGDRAFNCSALESISIPASVTTIGEEVFKDDSSLAQITVSQDSTAFSSADGVLYNAGRTELICYPAGITADTFVIPDTVTAIAPYAFYGACGLTAVTADDALLTIGESAFSGCRALASMNIPESVTSIGAEAFCSTGLKTVNIPASVVSVGDRAFYDDSKLTAVNVDAGNTVYCSVNGIFFDKDMTTLILYPEKKTDLTSYVVPDTVTAIAEGAFRSTAMKSVTLPGGLLTLGALAFNGANVTSIEVPAAVTVIPDFCFSANWRLKTVTILGEVTSVGTNAFANCSNLTHIVLPDSVQSIGDGVFSLDMSLTSIELPESLVSIGDRAFWYASSLKVIVLPAQVKTVGYDAFKACSSLSVIILNSDVSVSDATYIAGSPVTVYGRENSEAQSFCARFGLTFNAIVHGGTCGTADECSNVIWTIDKTGKFSLIGSGVMADYTDGTQTPWYRYMSDISSAVVGEGVTNIGAYTFEGFTNLTDVDLSASLNTIGEHAFKGCKALLNVNAAAGSELYSSQNGILFNKDATTILLYPQGRPNSTYSIPVTVTKLGDCAFEDAVNLTTVHFAYTITEFGRDAAAGCTGITKLVVPYTTTYLAEDSLNCGDALTGISFLGKDTVIADSADTLAPSAVIFAPEGSTAQAYAIKYGRTFISDDHSSYTTDGRLESGCYTEGKTGDKVCNVCGAVIAPSETISAGHKFELVNAKDATCTQNGYTGDTVCSVDGYVLTKGAVINALGHDWSEWTAITPATCTTEGSEYRVCSRCGEVETRTTSALGHDWSEWITDTEPTCTAEGSEHRVCANDSSEIETRAIPATGHSWGEWIVDTKVTCTQDGVKHRVCSVCGETETVVTPASHGPLELRDYKAATATEDGYTGDYYCKTCGELVTRGTVIPALGGQTIQNTARMNPFASLMAMFQNFFASLFSIFKIKK